MISNKYLEQYLNKKTYDNVVWEYDSALIQIIKVEAKETKQVYNLKYNNLKDRYDIMVVVAASDNVQAYCNCDKAKQGHKCEHVLWALIKVNEDLKIKNNLKKVEKTDNHKLALLEEIANYLPNKQEIMFQIELKSFIDDSVNLELYAGINKYKLYKIASIKKFIGQILLNKPLKYGKEFETTNYFLPNNLFNVITTLDYIALQNKVANKRDDLNNLTYKDFETLLKTLVNTYVDYQEEQYFVSNKINDIEIFLKQDDKLKLSIASSKEYNFIHENIIINERTKTLYILNEKDLKKLKFLELLNQQELINNHYEIDFDKQDETNLLTQVLPKIFNEFNVNLDSKLNIEVINEKLNVELFCYLQNKNIYIKPMFKYGEYHSDTLYNNKLIKRDLVFEEQVINTLLTQGYEYDPVTREFVITVQRSQFLFLTKNLLDLQKLYEVNLDDKLKKAILNFDSSAISISINKSTNKEYDYFELNFDIEGIDIQEISDIIDSFEQKKTYHKLNNDSFMKLNDLNVYNQLLFLKEVIQDNSYKLNTYRIPKYKAILMQEEIANKFNKYTFNQEFLNYIDSIKLIKPLNKKELEAKDYLLRDYQSKGVSWLSNLYEAKLGALLADEMGLGKTLQVISFLRLKKLTKTLIVVPKALLYNWENEFNKFYPEQNIILVDGTKVQREELIKQVSDNNILITTYPSIINDYKLYENIDFKCVVIDEAQYIKNPQTKTARCVKKLKAEFFIALTGTPIENSLLELWSIFDYLLPGYFNDLTNFNKKYKVKEEITNLDILKRATSPFIMRRLKKEVLKELPEKIESILYTEMEPKQKLIYHEYNERVQAELQDYINNGNFNNKAIEILAAITRLRQIAIDPSLFVPKYLEKSSKIQVFEELIEEIIQNQDKVLVFSQYTTLLTKLKNILSEKEIEFYYLDGKTRPKQRLMEVERFNKNKVPVYLISLKAGGVGLNLTSASNVIIMDPWWNPAVENQAIDRSHRIGQVNTVQVHRIVTKGTIEEKIMELKQDKANLIDNVLDNEVENITKMSTSEIISLLTADKHDK
ncbi:MAG: SNF2-related protein [Mycoplasmatales bacterium]